MKYCQKYERCNKRKELLSELGKTSSLEEFLLKCNIFGFSFNNVSNDEFKMFFEQHVNTTLRNGNGNDDWLLKELFLGNKVFLKYFQGKTFQDKLFMNSRLDINSSSNFCIKRGYFLEFYMDMIVLKDLLSEKLLHRSYYNRCLQKPKEDIKNHLEKFLRLSN